MPAWPGILPAVPLLGHRETAPDMVVRTEMDAGPAKLRRRFTAGVRKLRLPLVLNDAQVAALDDFFVTDLAGGSLRFDYAHPRTGAVIKCRFVAPPEYDLIAPSRWRVTLQLEVLSWSFAIGDAPSRSTDPCPAFQGGVFLRGCPS